MPMCDASYLCLFVSRLAELLLAGAIMNQVFQPFEAHIPYVLQVRV